MNKTGKKPFFAWRKHDHQNSTERLGSTPKKSRERLGYLSSKASITSEQDKRFCKGSQVLAVSGQPRLSPALGVDAVSLTYKSKVNFENLIEEKQTEKSYHFIKYWTLPCLNNHSSTGVKSVTAPTEGKLPKPTAKSYIGCYSNGSIPSWSPNLPVLFSFFTSMGKASILNYYIKSSSECFAFQLLPNSSKHCYC